MFADRDIEVLVSLDLCLHGRVFELAVRTVSYTNDLFALGCDSRFLLTEKYAVESKVGRRSSFKSKMFFLPTSNKGINILGRT